MGIKLEGKICKLQAPTGKAVYKSNKYIVVTADSNSQQIPSTIQLFFNVPIIFTSWIRIHKCKI